MYIYLHRCIYIYICIKYIYIYLFVLYRYLDKTSGFNDNYRNMELRYILGLRRIPKGFWMQSGSTQTKMTTGKTCFFTCFGGCVGSWLAFVWFLVLFACDWIFTARIRISMFRTLAKVDALHSHPRREKTQNIVTHEWWIQCMLNKLKT